MSGSERLCPNEYTGLLMDSWITESGFLHKSKVLSDMIALSRHMSPGQNVAMRTLSRCQADYDLMLSLVSL